MVDHYGPNPLAEAAQARDPRRFEEVASVLEPPKMFANGSADHPIFCASGIDPRELLRLPAQMRHAVAAEPDINRVFRYFEDFAANPDFADARLDHPGLREAEQRMNDWLDNTDVAALRDTRTEEQRQADEDAEYAQYYSPDKDRVSHANEQERRKQAGENLLPDFSELNRQRQAREMYERGHDQGPAQ